MTKPVRGGVSLAQLALFANGETPYVQVLASGACASDAPCLVLPIDDASVREMVERAFHAEWECKKFAREEHMTGLCHECLEGIIRAALGLEGET